MPKLNIRNTFFEKFLLNYGLYAAMVLIILIFSFLNPNYLTFSNILNIFEQSAYFIVVAMAASLTLIIGEQDLSVGGVLAGLSVLGAVVMKNDSLVKGIVVMYVAALFIGLFNGIFVIKAKLPSFIATIAVGYIARGLGAYYTDGATVQGLPKALTRFAWNRIFGIPIMLFIALIAFIVLVYILNFTTFGRTIFSFGANRKATSLMGINTTYIGIAAYVLSALGCCTAALMVLCRSGVARYSTLPDLQMQCIAAAVIGGTSLTGGKGSLAGTAFGVLLLVLVESGLNAMGVSAFWQEVFTGSIIIISIILDSYKTRSNA